MPTAAAATVSLDGDESFMIGAAMARQVIFVPRRGVLVMATLNARSDEFGPLPRSYYQEADHRPWKERGRS